MRRLRRAEGRGPRAAAHLRAHRARARTPGAGRAVLFFYYFNQFNGVHEGDWEGMQIAFDDADTPAQALAEGPSRMALFQHRGGEQADWDDAKVEKRGTHPVVYPAAGSHATFFGPAVYVSTATTGPAWAATTQRRPLHAAPAPRPVLLPEDPQPGDPMAWLLFGRPRGRARTAGSAATGRPARC